MESRFEDYSSDVAPRFGPKAPDVLSTLDSQRILTSELIGVVMSTTMHLVQTSFQQISLVGEAFIASFYDHLFESYPEIQPFFAHINLADQRHKLLMTLVLLVEHLDDLGALNEFLHRLGSIHADHLVQPKHFTMVRNSLLACLEQYLGDAWSPALHEAWTAVYQQLVDKMQISTMVTP